MKGHPNYDLVVSYNFSSGQFWQAIIRSKVTGISGFFLPIFANLEIEANCHVMTCM